MNEEQIFFSGKKSKSSLFDLSQNSVTKIRENLITIFVALHWIAVIVSLFLYHPKQNVLTNISNYLQLILNSCTLTTSLINPILKNSVYQRILKILKQFDSNISTLGLNLEYKKTNLRHMLAFVAVILYITYMISYDQQCIYSQLYFLTIFYNHSNSTDYLFSCIVQCCMFTALN